MTSLKTSPALPSIQILRGFAALLIVVWHSDLALELFDHDYWRDASPVFRAQLYPFWANHLNLGVDLFFCISGFIMTMLAVNTSTAKDGWIFLRNRVARIIPPYWFFTVLLLALYILAVPFHIWRLNGLLMHDVPDTLLSFLLWPMKDGPILAIGWTLIHEFFFYYFVFVIILVGQGRRLPYYLGVAALIGIVFRFTGIEILNGYLLSDYYVEFFMGSLAFVFHKRTMGFAPALQIGAALLLFFLASYVLDQVLDTPAFYLTTVISAGCISFLLISGLQGLHARRPLTDSRCGRFFVRLGDASYSLYLSHWFILSALGQLAAPFSTAGRPFIIVWHVLAITVTILAAMLFAEWVELPLHRRILKALKGKQTRAFRLPDSVFP